MIRPLFSWLKRGRGETPSSGREAGRREVGAVATLRDVVFVDREQAALHAQLARAPRDAGALFGLLQWHARRDERGEVEALAHILWDETDAEGGLWLRAAALGRKIDPTNPLYSEDPFAALAEHAAQRTHAGVSASDAEGGLPAEQWRNLNLDLPDLVAAPGLGDALASLQGTDHGTEGAVSPQASSLNAQPDGGDTNWLSAQTASLPAAIQTLSLDLDDDATWSEPASDRIHGETEKPGRFHRPVRAPGRKQRGRKKPGK